MHFIDWSIVFLALFGMVYSVSFSTGLMKSVTDFLSAGRTAGRYDEYAKHARHAEYQDQTYVFHAYDHGAHAFTGTDALAECISCPV